MAESSKNPTPQFETLPLTCSSYLVDIPCTFMYFENLVDIPFTFRWPTPYQILKYALHGSPDIGATIF